MPNAPATKEIALRPGERLVAGRPYIYNGDLYRLAVALEDLLAAPAYLGGLTYDQVTTLATRAMIVEGASERLLAALPSPVDMPLVRDVSRRAAEERGRRDEYAAVYRRAEAQLLQGRAA